MSDSAWGVLRLWPWDDKWLNDDESLGGEFVSEDLADVVGGSLELTGAHDGERGEDEGCVVLSGRMGDLRDTTLLEQLREREIAYVFTLESGDDWDGQESWWHPGMGK